MFTGIVEVLGKLKRREKRSTMNQLVISLGSKDFLMDVQLGDSILVNGICLTLIKFLKKEFTVEYMPETEKITTIPDWKPGKFLNLEKALRLNRGLDGHIVQGHIDGTGKVKSFVSKRNERILTVAADSNILRYIVQKGSVAIDGISLTIAEIRKTEFSVNIIKHTIENSNLKYLKPRQHVNIENDIIGKYIERFTL
ncbi:riboflavin synthase [Candidatus Dependentiae bacterium]|nr:riboflavin synthase [Candidatus Dependentiae bacterium]